MLLAFPESRPLGNDFDEIQQFTALQAFVVGFCIMDRGHDDVWAVCF